MNTIISQLQNRRSVRQFTKEPVKEEDLDIIIKSAQQSATSINGEQISLVFTRDHERLKKIATFCGQPYIEFCSVFVTVVIDFNRTNVAVEKYGKKQVIEQYMEGVLVGAVDAGIVLTTLQVAAESLGYGTTAIGAIRNDPEAFIELLDLPLKTFPIVGSMIGVPDKAKLPLVKPRVPMNTFAFKDTYDSKAVAKGVSQYNETYDEWHAKQGPQARAVTSYIETVGNFYDHNYFPKGTGALKKQGFDFK